MPQTKTQTQTKRTPVPTPTPNGALDLPAGARADFDGAQKWLTQTVRIRRTDGSLVVGTLVALTFDYEVQEVVATIKTGDEAVEAVLKSELRYIQGPKAIAASQTVSAGSGRSRTGVPTVVDLSSLSSLGGNGGRDALLEAASKALGRELAPLKELFPDTQEMTPADEIEADEIAALDARIEASVPAEEPPADETVEAPADETETATATATATATKKAAKPAKTPTPRAYSKAAQLGKK